MRLLGVDETNYEFSLTAWTIETWREDRHVFLPELTAGEAASCATRIGYGEHVENKCANLNAGAVLWGSVAPSDLGDDGAAGRARGRTEISQSSGEVLWEFGPEFYSENPAEFAGWGLDYTNSFRALWYVLPRPRRALLAPVSAC